jgi:hypothetical protein
MDAYRAPLLTGLALFFGFALVAAQTSSAVAQDVVFFAGSNLGWEQASLYHRSFMIVENPNVYLHFTAHEFTRFHCSAHSVAWYNFAAYGPASGAQYYNPNYRPSCGYYP